MRLPSLVFERNDSLDLVRKRGPALVVGDTGLTRLIVLTAGGTAERQDRAAVTNVLVNLQQCFVCLLS